MTFVYFNEVRPTFVPREKCNPRRARLRTHCAAIGCLSKCHLKIGLGGDEQALMSEPQCR